jgi:hypothetical protein
MNYTPETWAIELLNRLGYPTTKLGVQDIICWENAEGGHWHNSARYNPLNTTEGAKGAKDINSVGVKAYTSWDEGFTATIATLQNGYYQTLLDDLASGGTQLFGMDVGISPWGTEAFTVTGVSVKALNDPSNVAGTSNASAVASASTTPPNLTAYPGLELNNNGVYQINYLTVVSGGNTVLTFWKNALGMSDKGTVKDEIENWNYASKMQANKLGPSSSKYIQYVNASLGDEYGAKGATTAAGGNDTTANLTGWSWLEKEWWVIVLVVLAGAAILIIMAKSIGGKTQLVMAPPLPV